MSKRYKYDVAISFAEEDRNAALALSLALEMIGFENVYYYPEQRKDTWGKDLEATLTNIYVNETKYAVVLLSQNYFDPEKIYVPIEQRAIESRINQDASLTYMMPVNLSSDINYIEQTSILKLGIIEWNYNPKLIASILKELLGMDYKEVTKKMNSTTIFNISGSDMVIFNKSRITTFNKNKHHKDEP